MSRRGINVDQHSKPRKWCKYSILYLRLFRGFECWSTLIPWSALISRWDVTYVRYVPLSINRVQMFLEFPAAAMCSAVLRSKFVCLSISAPASKRSLDDDDDVYLRLQHGKASHNLVYMSYIKHINPACKA
jgi:hypothetical protein